MDTSILLLIVGLTYAVVFSAMGMLRREGTSMQFIAEVLIVTVVIVAGGMVSGSHANPILFVVFLYLLTMRSRLLVDLGNLISARGRQGTAVRVMQVALQLFPDRQTRLIVLASMGIVHIRRKNPEAAREILKGVLQEAEQGGLSMQYTAACHYHLGLAHQRLGAEAAAVRHYRLAVDEFPSSIYGKAAEKALQERKKGKTGPQSEGLGER